jgi:hypothetical protein
MFHSVGTLHDHPLYLGRPDVLSLVGKLLFREVGGVHRITYSFSCQSFLFTNECTSDCLKNNNKIYIKMSPTCFGAVTPSSGSTLSVLAKVTLVKIASYGTSVCD